MCNWFEIILCWTILGSVKGVWHGWTICPVSEVGGYWNVFKSCQRVCQLLQGPTTKCSGWWCVLKLLASKWCPPGVHFGSHFIYYLNRWLVSQCNKSKKCPFYADDTVFIALPHPWQVPQKNCNLPLILFRRISTNWDLY